MLRLVSIYNGGECRWLPDPEKACLSLANNYLCIAVKLNYCAGDALFAVKLDKTQLTTILDLKL